MKIKRNVVRIFFLFLIGLSFFLSVSYAQTIRERLRERIRSRLESRTQSKNSSGDYEFSIEHDGLMRKYYVHVPESYNKSQPTAVILNFHGGGHNAKGMMKQSGMNETADKYGFIVVYPEGTGKRPGQKLLLTWNAGICCGDARDNEVDDVGFVRAMLSDLESKFNIDKNRIYATGYSNGGFLAYRLACELSDKIAAIAPVASSLGIPRCTPQRAVSIIHFQGKDDPCVPYEGGECGGCMGPVFGTCDSTQETIEKFVKKYSCAPNPKITYQNDKVVCKTYTNCTDNAELTLCSIEDAGHVWPGGDDPKFVLKTSKPTDAIDANEVMWEFFKRHPKK